MHLTEATDFASWKGKMKAHGAMSKQPKNASYYSCGGAGTIYLQAYGQTPETATVVLDNEGSAEYDNQPTGYTPLDDSVGAGVIGNLIVTNRARVMFAGAGKTTKIFGDVDTTGGTILDYGGTVELAGGRTQTIRGGGVWDDLLCTVPGKTIKIGTGAADALNFRATSVVTLTGADGNPIVLTPAVPGETWKVVLPVDGVADISFAAVDHSDASGGIAIMTSNSTNGGGNTNWMFPKPMSPGDSIVWTGAADTDWNNMANWEDKYAENRTPMPDDKVVIPAGCERWPVIPSAYSYWGLDVRLGATLTIAGGPVAVTNELSVAGTLVFTGSQRLDIAATNATFAGATLDPGESTVRILDGVQAFDPGDLRFCRVEVRRSGGPLAFASGFKAKTVDVRVTDSSAMTFAAGSTIEADSIVGTCTTAADGNRLELKSSVPGTAWTLKSPRNICMSGVSVSDSTASDASAVAGLSDDDGNNTRWTFGGDVRVWLGGSDNFSAAANWCPAGALTENSDVVILSSAKNPKVSANASVRSLTIGGDHQAVQLNVSAELSVSQSAYVGAGATVVIDKPMTVGTDFVMEPGAKLTHTALPSTANEPKDECYRLKLSVGGDMTVASNAFIDVSVCGYSKRMGPGGIDGSLCGGTYGGCGRNGTKSCYGSVRRPINSGSGGYSYGGGGAVQLVVGGTLTVDGKILAESSTANSNGTGSGGSIWLTAGALVGEGYISAMSANTTWPAGGGRISIVQTTAEALAFNIANIEVGAVGATTGPGSLYVENANDEPDCGELIVDGRGKSPDYACELGLSVEDAGVPFKKITLKNTGRMKISANTVVRTWEVEIPTGCILQGAGVLELVASSGEVARVNGSFTLGGLVCTNAGARVEFAAGKTVSISDGGILLFAGTEENPVELMGADGAEWLLNLSVDAKADITYASVSNCNASAGSSVTAVNSRDLGGNVKWSFITPIPVGEVIEWTGSVDSDWSTVGNWSRGRAPVETDDVRILDPAASNMPVMGVANVTLSKLTVANGTTLTLSGKTVSVMDELNVSGTLAFTGRQLLEIAASAPTFAGGTVVPAESTVRILEGVETFDPGNCTFCRVDLPMAANRALVLTDGIQARSFEVRATDDAEIAFAAGETVEAETVICSCMEPGKYLTLRSSAANAKWFVKSPRISYMTGVRVSDSTATDAAAVASLSLDAGGNANWAFDNGVIEWVGGASGKFDEAANWYPTGIPGVTNDVILRGAAEITADGNVSVRTLALLPDEVKGSLTVNGVLTTVGDAVVGTNATMTLSTVSDFNEIGGDFVVGGTVTHPKLSETADTLEDGANGAKLLVRAKNVVVERGGKIDATSKGYHNGKGPAAGGTYKDASGQSYSVGAGHAGTYNHTLYATATTNAYPVLTDYRAYGSLFEPTTYGSGGEKGTTVAGGGVIRLVVSGDITVDGDISADGVHGSDTGYGCSGAGGSVWITANGTLRGEGTISASGGKTLYDGTAGGGRIAVYVGAKEFAGRFTASGKASFVYGDRAMTPSPGTVLLKLAKEESYSLLIDYGDYDSLTASMKSTFQTDGFLVQQATPIPTEEDLDKLDLFKLTSITCGRISVLNLMQDLKVYDLNFTADTASKARLNLHKLTIRNSTHKKGRGWAVKNVGDDPIATHIWPCEQDGAKGKIVWKGGFALIVR